jgi:hypothetical protein
LQAAAPAGPLLVMIGRALADAASVEAESEGDEATPPSPTGAGRKQAS